MKLISVALYDENNERLNDLLGLEEALEVCTDTPVFQDKFLFESIKGVKKDELYGWFTKLIQFLIGGSFIAQPEKIYVDQIILKDDGKSVHIYLKC